MSENFEMLKVAGLCEVGDHHKCAQYVGKSMAGDEPKVYVCPNYSEPDRQPEGAESIRLGDMRVMNVIRQNPYTSRTYQTVADAQVSAADPFLHRDVGESNANSGPAGGARRPVGSEVPGSYLYQNPDADARDAADEGLGNGTDRTASPIAPAALPNWPNAAEVGARVIKRRAGIFTDLICGRAK